jgi:hypothetical protein
MLTQAFRKFRPAVFFGAIAHLLLFLLFFFMKGTWKAISDYHDLPPNIKYRKAQVVRMHGIGK